MLPRKLPKLYLAGPMSGIPFFNFPLFNEATKALRGLGFEIISPAEEDYKHGVGQMAEKSLTGDPKELHESWGTILARDVRIIADEVDGIVFLPGWEGSRGARLETFVALLQPNHVFYLYDGPDHKPILAPRWLVWDRVVAVMGHTVYGSPDIRPFEVQT